MARELADFLGQWRIAREITHGDGSTGRFEGVAEWVAEGAEAEPGAEYVERGVLHTAGGAFQAERRYRWGPGMEVYFDDGRYFHTVPSGGGEAAHWCEPDQYDVTYEFSQWPEWSSRWQVRGPRKDYVMITRYSRLPQ